MTHESIILGFVSLAKNEIQRIKTGKAPGPSMRDCLGQWEATVREAELLLEANKMARFMYPELF